MGTNIFDVGFMISAIPQLLPYVPITFGLSLGSSLIGLVVAFAVALIRIHKTPVIARLCQFYVSFVRGTPMLVQLFLVYYGIPIVLQAVNASFGTEWNINGVSKLVYIFFSFSLNTGAYMSETIRSAILSVDPGQLEACYSVNMTTRQAYCHVILPQAMAVAIPSLGNSFISVVKETSLVFSIGFVELMSAAKMLGARSFRYFEVYIVVSILYWVICAVIEAAMSLLEKYMRKYERSEATV